MVGRWVFCYVLLVVLLFICLSGCGPQARLPSIEQLAEFENAGPILPSVDLDRLMRAKIGVGPYRVVPGDVLELTIPAILQVVTVEQPELIDGVTPYACRVSKSGFITLPIVGEIEVGGKTLAEIELAVIEAYHPRSFYNWSCSRSWGLRASKRPNVTCYAIDAGRRHGG